jgi:hypothetical protein
MQKKKSSKKWLKIHQILKKKISKSPDFYAKFQVGSQ